MRTLGKTDLSCPVPADLRRGIVAIGNFDGIHLGHRLVLNTALEIADRTGKAALVLTFDPHPRAVFQPHAAPGVLTTSEQRTAIFDKLGFKGVVNHPFDLEIAAVPAVDFIESVLVNWLSASAVVTGCDFHFGRKREGNRELLQASGDKYGFATTFVKELEDGSGRFVSSTRIRALLKDGELEAANRLLGYPYTVDARLSLSDGRLWKILLDIRTPVGDGRYLATVHTSNGVSFEAVARVRDNQAWLENPGFEPGGVADAASVALMRRLDSVPEWARCDMRAPHLVQPVTALAVGLCS